MRLSLIAAGSALFHLALLAALGYVAPSLRPPFTIEGPSVVVALMRPDTAPSSPLRAGGPAAAASPHPTSTAPGEPGPPPPVISSQTALGAVRPHPGCNREVLLLLTPQERRACDVQTAAAALARGDLGGAVTAQPPVRIPVEGQQAFDAELADRRDGRDLGRAMAELDAVEAERSLRRPGTWTGQGQGVEASVRVDCVLAFSGWRLGRPNCAGRVSVLP